MIPADLAGALADHYCLGARAWLAGTPIPKEAS